MIFFMLVRFGSCIFGHLTAEISRTNIQTKSWTVTLQVKDAILLKSQVVILKYNVAISSLLCSITNM